MCLLATNTRFQNQFYHAQPRPVSNKTQLMEKTELKYLADTA